AVEPLRISNNDDCTEQTQRRQCPAAQRNEIPSQQQGNTEGGNAADQHRIERQRIGRQGAAATAERRALGVAVQSAFVVVVFVEHVHADVGTQGAEQDQRRQPPVDCCCRTGSADSHQHARRRQQQKRWPHGIEQGSKGGRHHSDSGVTVVCNAIFGRHCSHSSCTSSFSAKVSPFCTRGSWWPLSGVENAMPPARMDSSESARILAPLNRPTSMLMPLAFRNRVPSRTSGA